LGRTLFRVWLAVSLVYVLGIGVLSVGPIRSAIELAGRPAPPPAPVVHTTGPEPSVESPTMRAAEIVGRQVLIGLAPPLLLLWFGWDAWFAVAGFLGIHSAPVEDGDP
jgi:hypothetical protein